jgi:hypothetical protein
MLWIALADFAKKQAKNVAGGAAKGIKKKVAKRRNRGGQRRNWSCRWKAMTEIMGCLQ